MLVLPYRPKTCTVFCDETAHAGPNWLDEHHFYMTAAWIVREEHLPRFRGRTEELRGELRLQHDRPELKGRDFRNNKGRQELALQWLRSITGDNVPLAYPAYYVLERKFGACGKIVDLLLDPWHNPGAEWLSTMDHELREEITEIVYAECPPVVLTSFREALFKPSEVAWSAALARVASVEWSDERLRTSLTAANEIADTLYDVEFGRLARQGKNPALPHSPNYFSFRHLLQSCDIAIDEMWPGCQAVAIHDEQKQYDPYFRELFAWTSGAGAEERRRGIESPDLLGGLHHIKDFQMARSTDEVGIQSADLLGWILYQIIGATCGDPSAATIAKEAEFFELVISPWLMREDNVVARMHASWEMKARMWAREHSISRVGV